LTDTLSAICTIVCAKLRFSTILRVRTVLVRVSVGARPRHATLRIAAAVAIATMVGSIVFACAIGDSDRQTPFWRPVAKLCAIKPRTPARERVQPAASEFNRSRFGEAIRSLPTSKDDARVDAAEAESIGNCMLHGHVPCLAGHNVDALGRRVRIVEIEGGRRHLVP
jgi:hypothetical protein